MELRLPHLNDDLTNRLYNWKFSQAAARLDGTEPEVVTDTVQALAATFGDVGWFGGDLPRLPTVIRAAVASLIGYEVDDSGSSPAVPTLGYWTGDNPSPQPGPPYCASQRGEPGALEVQCELPPGGQHGDVHRATLAWPVEPLTPAEER